jgi:hypothetical protein
LLSACSCNASANSCSPPPSPSRARSAQQRPASARDLSTDVDELLELTDRVYVFREGALFAELTGKRLTRHALVSSFFGRRPADGL